MTALDAIAENNGVTFREAYAIASKAHPAEEREFVEAREALELVSSVLRKMTTLEATARKRKEAATTIWLAFITDALHGNEM